MARNQHYGVTEQAKAAKHRRDDAQALFDAGRWRGAMYMGGYAVECLLKAKLMLTFGSRNLEELEAELRRRGILSAQSTIFIHQLAALLQLIPGSGRLRNDATLWRLHGRVNRWVPAWRYFSSRTRRDEADSFLEAVDRIMHWVEANV